MATLIIQDSFDPYYAGRRKWVSPSRARNRQEERGQGAQEPGEHDDNRRRDEPRDDEARH